MENNDLISTASNIINVNEETFMSEVVEVSKTKPVIVDFWAPWCEPCKTLTPVLEDAVKGYENELILAKIDIDQNQNIAAQLRIQSIPTVYTFFEGKVVDGFQGAKSNSEIIEFVKKAASLSGTGQEVEDLIDEHQKDKSKRLLQNKIADSITSMVHSEDDLKNAVKASKVLFGKSSKEDLESLDENTFNEIFDGVPSSSIGSKELAKGVNIDFLLAKNTNFLKSMGEARRSIKENSISVNKIKVYENTIVSNKDLINNKYLLLQRGQKNYYLVIVK